MGVYLEEGALSTSTWLRQADNWDVGDFFRAALAAFCSPQAFAAAASSREEGMYRSAVRTLSRLRTTLNKAPWYPKARLGRAAASRM